MSSRAYPVKSYKRPAKSGYRKAAAKPAYKKSGSRAYQKKSYQKSRYLAPVLSSVGGALGGYIGGPVGSTAGSALGSHLGEKIRSMTGYGDYSIRKNSLLTPGNPPAVRNGALHGGSIIISHKEYLGDVISSSSANTFSQRRYDINPGDDATFPWLSQLAANFQQYKIMGMAFEYRTMSCDALNSTNTALGQVIMATSYDALSPDYVGKADMENSAYGQSVKPSLSCVHLIECDDRTLPISELYIRTGGIPSNADKRMYDLGAFTIATNGFQGTSVNCGELWVTYQVMLLKPRIYDSLGEDVSYFTAINITGITNSLPMGTVANMVVPPIAPYEGTPNNLDVSFPSNLTISIPGSAVRKYYNISWTWIGPTATTDLLAPAVSYTNAAADGGQFTIDGGTSWIAGYQIPDSAAAASCKRLYLVSSFRTDGSGKAVTVTLTVSGTTKLPTSCSSMQIVIWELPYDARQNV